MRKAATVTFASMTTSQEIVFYPPESMSMDDLYFTLPTRTGIKKTQELTPFRLALRCRRRRAQRLVIKAMAVSFEYNINVFEVLKQLWLGLLDAAGIRPKRFIMV